MLIHVLLSLCLKFFNAYLFQANIKNLKLGTHRQAMGAWFLKIVSVWVCCVCVCMCVCMCVWCVCMGVCLSVCLPRGKTKPMHLGIYINTKIMKKVTSTYCVAAKLMVIHLMVYLQNNIDGFGIYTTV